MKRYERIAQGLIEKIEQAIKRTELIKDTQKRIGFFCKEFEEIFRPLRKKADGDSDGAANAIRTIAELGKRILTQLASGEASPNYLYKETVLKVIIDFFEEKTLKDMGFILLPEES